MLKANARKRRNQTYLSKGQRGKGIFGDIKKMGERLNKKYAGLAKMTGVDKAVKGAMKKKLPTIESKLQKAGVSAKIIKPLSKEINKKLGGAYMKLGEKNQVGEGVIKDALTRLYAMITDKDPYDVGVDKKKEKELYDTIYRDQEQGEKDKKARQRELKRKADEERRALFDKMSFGSGCGCEDCYIGRVGQVGTGWFDDMISTLAVLPIPGISCIARTVAVVKTAVDTATSDHPAKAFGGVIGDLADTADKIAPAFLKEFTTPGKEYVKAIGFGAISSDDTTKMLKVGMKHLDALMDNILVAKLPPQKAKQVMTARNQIKRALPEINKLKIGGSFVSSTLSGLIGNIAREGLRKPKRGKGYLTGKDIVKMNKCRSSGKLYKKGKCIGMNGGSYWSCANANPSCKKLYQGMKQYHACAVKKNCRNREIRRADAEERMGRIGRPVSTSTSGTQTELPLNQPRPRARRRPRRPAPVSQGSQDIREFFS
jgi:hypothetical protein